MAQRTILASLWTNLGTNSPFRAFESLAHQFRRQNIRLILVTRDDVGTPSSDLDIVTVPLKMADFTCAKESVLPVDYFDMSEFQALEAHWWGEDNVCVQPGLRAWEDLFKQYTPSLVLAWGSTLPHSRAMIRAAQRKCIPYYVMERGFLKESLQVSPLGQGAYFAPSYDYNFVRQLREPDAHMWDRCKQEYLRQWLDNGRFDKGQPYSTLSSYKKRILFLGSFDVGAGLGMFEKNIGAPCFNGITSSWHGLQRVMDAIAGMHDIELLVRPHPFDKSDYNSLTSDRLRVCRYDSLPSLFAAVDIVISVGSSTAFGAFFCEKPLLTLVRSEFDQSRATVRCYADDDLRSVIQNVFNDACLRKHLIKKGRQVAVSTVQQHQFYYGNSDSVALHTIQDLSHWLGYQLS